MTYHFIAPGTPCRSLCIKASAKYKWRMVLLFLYHVILHSTSFCVLRFAFFSSCKAALKDIKAFLLQTNDACIHISKIYWEHFSHSWDLFSNSNNRDICQISEKYPMKLKPKFAFVLYWISLMSVRNNWDFKVFFLVIVIRSLVKCITDVKSALLTQCSVNPLRTYFNVYSYLSCQIQ